MAAAIASSPCASLAFRPTKLIHSSLSQAPKLSCPLQCFRFLHLTAPYKDPTITVCRGKLDGSAGEDPDEIGGEVYFDDNDLIEDESDDDETESSIDLFIRFFQSMFKKISKRAKKASRSILPSVISPQLVSFAVDGVLLLASLSIVKAFLECKSKYRNEPASIKSYKFACL
ncbi:protein SHORT HYPOCOTYL IN WHITE LIGHT 1 isoform X2 [Manihot esculenta]|uniref:protein SHORT HYPOCOTYL IN WHITE LIGHT 1 isoform X2 n=1 Tax=Manihot esculenta TaxID=3983 RepID=UPI000B5D8726|nr:protein SHORT HYPOCOTYL IN WHITE LIGHT 1 isoform X2 [Manihot esculenta]